jgi:tRNA 2-thiouridine synthesizing protein C
MATVKRYLFILQDAPYQGVALQEALDVILTTAAFEQVVSLLFLDDGVFQLNQHQQPRSLGLKDTLAMFDALALYDITELYVERESLTQRGLEVEELTLPVTVVPRKDVAQLLRQFDRVC